MGKNIDNDALERFENIWQHVECGIAIVDAQTRRILDMNPVAMRMFGGEKDKVIGSLCNDCFCPANKNACPIIDKNQVVDRSERVFVNAKGERLPIIKSVAKITYNGRPVLLESFTDITNIKEAEAKLRQFEINERATRAKSDFLAKMSHEMRTPMNAIIGMTKIAQDTDDLKKLSHCLATIETSANHLLGLINDVLDMSKIEAGKFEIEEVPMNIEQILMKVCNLVSEPVEKKGISLSIDIPDDIRLHYLGDDMRISQVLTNILSNAVKFTPEKGKIKVTVKETKREKEKSRLAFSVSDTGIGMTPEQLKRLFNAFEQADSSISRRFGGSGLGLAISKNIIEKMDGSLWVESEYGVGSTFAFELPLKYIRSTERENIKKAINKKGLKALIADTNVDSRGRLRTILTTAGIDVEEAKSAKEALNMFKTAFKTHNFYDFIFMDIDLPDLNGIDAAQEIKKTNEAVPVILMTTFFNWNKIDKEAKKAGIRHYISKPVFSSSVMDAINETLGVNISKSDENKKRDSAEKIVDLSHVKILLVEDIDINREIFAALFEKSKLNIDFAENGMTAVEIFAANPEKYDMILMDVQMPFMDGYEATREIRSLTTPRAKTIPIIAMTANVFKEDVERCLAAGMNDHLAKPIDSEIVTQKILKYSAK